MARKKYGKPAVEQLEDGLWMVKWLGKRTLVARTEIDGDPLLLHHDLK